MMNGSHLCQYAAVLGLPPTQLLDHILSAFCYSRLDLHVVHELCHSQVWRSDHVQSLTWGQVEEDRLSLQSPVQQTVSSVLVNVLVRYRSHCSY